MVAVTDETRKSVWDDFIDSEYYTRYYSKLSDRYRKRHFCVRYTLLGLVLVEAAVMIPLLSQIPQPLGTVMAVVVGLAIVALTVFDAISNDATNTAKLAVASEECHILHTEWRDLWIDIESNQIEENDAREKQHALLGRTHLIGARVEVNQDDDRSQKSAQEANQVMESICMPMRAVQRRLTWTPDLWKDSPEKVS